MHSYQMSRSERKPSGALRSAGDRPARYRGFTLIELLVVIAIIAILAAIIFPVFSTVRENARESTTMSNMHDISSALALYKLDNRRYPDVLFAYACNGQNDSVTNLPCNVNDSMASVASDPNNHDLLVGLYPEYVKDWHDFTCPNNPITDPAAKTQAAVAVNVLCPKTNVAGGTYTDAAGAQPCANVNPPGQLAAAHQWFFAADALDVSPEVSNVNQFAGGNSTPANWNFLPRYQTSWMSFDNGTNNNANDPDYIRQLRWQNPPANTYVTSVTHHVPNADRLLVLYESGTVKKAPMPSGWFSGTVTTPAGWESGYIDNQPDIAAPATGGNTQAVFWRYDGTH